MNDTPKHDEPSMEEILSSIRKIIAEDDNKDETPKEEASKDILSKEEEHKEKAHEKEEHKVNVKGHVMATKDNEKKETPSTTVTTKTTTAPKSTETYEEDVLKLTESMVAHEKPSSVDVQLDVETTSPKFKPATTEGIKEEELLSETARQKTSAAFAELGEALKETHKDVPESELTASIPLGKSGQTLESIVREMLKPMLQEWINTNLPKITERMVKQEINKMMQRY